MRALILALVLAWPAWAQDSVPRAVPGAAEMDISWRGHVEIEIPLDQPVPWRVFTLSDPPRLVVDTSEVDWAALPSGFAPEEVEVRTGRVAPGWTRLVLVLEDPVTVTRAWMETTRPALRIEAAPGQGPDGPLVEKGWDVAAEPRDLTTRPRQTGDRPLVVALDPGHGGIDPGAERRGVTEADLMLRFSRELAEVLRRAGHQVVFTREGDDFVGLRGRPALARAAGADLFISLHADAVAGGGAEGATVYTLAETSDDAISAELVERQGTGDLLLGVDLADGGDEIAQILVELARVETAPRSDAFARILVEQIGAAGIDLHKRPRLGANFTVLKAPDIPSILLELGFLSSEADLANLVSPDWRARMAVAIARAIDAWAIADAADALRLRR